VSRFLRNLFWFPLWLWVSLQLRYWEWRHARLEAENLKLRRAVEEKKP